MKKRIAKTISSKEDLDFLLNLTEEESQKLSFITENFCPFENKPPRFNVYDILTIPADYYGPTGHRNKKPFVTTVGKWIFNKVFIEQDLFELFHYINEPINKKLFGKINKVISYALVEDKIPLKAMSRYILKTQKFQPYCTILAPAITIGCMEIPKQIRPLREKLLKKYEKEIAKNDPAVSSLIEKELLAKCKEILKDDEFMDLIKAGSRITWDNNFKNMFVYRGAVKESDPKKGGYSIIKSNFADGITREDYADFANSLTGGPYSRAKKTEVGGAWEKMFVRAFQHLRVLPDGTDCGTHRTLPITLTNDNISDWMYSYIMENGKPVELTSDIAKKYIGKTVNMRFSGLCESPKGICSICAGHLFNRIGLNEVGIASYAMCSVLKNISMKAFHDGVVRLTDIEKDYGLDKIFGLNE